MQKRRNGDRKSQGVINRLLLASLALARSWNVVVLRNLRGPPHAAPTWGAVFWRCHPSGRVRKRT